MEPFGFVILGIVLLAIITIGSDNYIWVFPISVVPNSTHCAISRFRSERDY